MSLFLENGDWANADIYCEKVLDIEPENAGAYIFKLMAARHCKKETDLGNGKIPLHTDMAYNTALRFADEATAERLIAYDNRIEANIEQAEAKQSEREEKAELAAQAKAQIAELARQKKQQEQRQAQDMQLVAEATQKLQVLQKKRKRATAWCIIWIFLFWPVAIYHGIKIAKLTDEISKLEQIAGVEIKPAEDLPTLKKKRTKAIVWSIVWFFIFWPISIYHIIKIITLSKQIKAA